MSSFSAIRDLAGGRMPSITRTALASGLVVFLLTILVFHPQAGGEKPATPLPAPVLLIPPGDTRMESLVLLDSSVAYLPARLPRARVGQGEAGQPMEAPFAPFSPTLLVDPGKYDVIQMNDRLPLEAAKASVPTPFQAIPLSRWEPYATLGMKTLKNLEIPPRTPFYEIYPISGSVKPILNGKINHQGVIFREINEKPSNNSLVDGKIEIHLGVDSMGLCAPGAMIKSSGDADLDRAVLRWVSGVDWARQLPPGYYRLRVGP